jgi:hypothetical protein
MSRYFTPQSNLLQGSKIGPELLRLGAFVLQCGWRRLGTVLDRRPNTKVPDAANTNEQSQSSICRRYRKLSFIE